MTESQLHIVQEINTSDLCAVISSRNNLLEDENRRLKNENALLKGRNEGFEQQIMGLLIKYEEVYKRFPDLKSAMDKAKVILKENAELKSKKGCETCNKFSDIQLSKAKELIKNLLLIADNRVSQMEFQLDIAEAKQFLKECE